MKKSNYIIGIATLILVSMMAFLSCEKEEIVPVPNTMAIDLSLSDEVTAYLSESELNKFYKEVESVKASLAPHQKIRLMSIQMENKVKYTQLYTPDPPVQINFEGTGFWSKFGTIRFEESVVIYNEGGNSIGNGAIYLQKKGIYEDNIAPIIEAPLYFESSSRKDITHGFPQADDTVKGNDRNITQQRFHSKFNFTYGEDIFEGAYGKATKLEIHNPDRPGYCKGVIYGYVVMKVFTDKNDIATVQ